MLRLAVIEVYTKRVSKPLYRVTNGNIENIMDRDSLISAVRNGYIILINYDLTRDKFIEER